MAEPTSPAIDINLSTSNTHATVQPKAEQERAKVLDELVGRPLADIADEVSRLREENVAIKAAKTRLEDALRVLVPELDGLRKENKELRGALQFLLAQYGYVQSTPRDPINIGTFPHEILLRIVRASRVPRYQNDPSVFRGPHSSWMSELRFRKGLIFVCKNWSGPATEALYEDIVLRRMGQIPALANALTASWSVATPTHQRGLADCINSIRVDSCGILPEFADGLHEAFQTILERCTNLSVLEVHVDTGLPTTIDQSRGTKVFFPVWFLQNETYPGLKGAVQERLTTTLRVLDLSVPLAGARALRQLHRTLSQCAAYLETLKLGVYIHSADEEIDVPTLPVLSLVRLRELYVHTARTELYYLLCAVWKMPALQRLTTLKDCSVPLSLLSQHGSHLRYLHFFPRSWNQPDNAGIERVPEFCPALEHLVVSVRSYKTELLMPPLRSDSLRYLDIWTCDEYRCRRWSTTLDPPSESVLPALRSVRRLSGLHVDLPTICHPAKELADGELALYTMIGVRYLQTKTHVISDARHLSMRHLSPKVQGGVEGRHIRRQRCWIAEAFAKVGELSQPTILPAKPLSSVSSDDEYDSNEDEFSERCTSLGDESDGSNYEPEDDVSDDETDVSDEWYSEGASDA
ncbi:hypothetical protein C8Q73DRAFT_32731 [Cubamyces lactineus]|nr:hypothetical protein C8Q73DRAFT_32731 [Cubamyces lactineus]